MFPAVGIGKCFRPFYRNLTSLRQRIRFLSYADKFSKLRHAFSPPWRVDESRQGFFKIIPDEISLIRFVPDKTKIRFIKTDSDFAKLARALEYREVDEA